MSLENGLNLGFVLLEAIMELCADRAATEALFGLETSDAIGLPSDPAYIL